MKRFFTLILGVALIASMHSCKTIEENNGQIVEKTLKITAVIDGKMETRVSYDVDNTANTITPAWEVGDEVFGFDSNNNTFTLKVTELIPGGAVLEPVGSYSPTEGTAVYAIFAPGYSVSNLIDNTLTVNLAEQGGVLNASTPALMCATGSVKADNELELHFSNQTAIIGVKKFQLNGATAAGSVTSMTINGVITTGKFQVNDGVLELVPGTETGSITATHPNAPDGGWTTDANGICEAGVYFAAMPTSEAPEITLNAVADGIKYVNVSAITASAMEPGKYYYMSKKFESAVVAIINDSTPYYTIDEAWDFAKSTTEPCTIKLLKDCEATDAFVLPGNGCADVTLDLNGKVISTSHAIQVLTNRRLTITDSSSIISEEQGSIFSTYNGGSALYISDGSLLISGGTLISNATDKNAISLTADSDATVDGGTIISAYSGINNSGDLTITDGRIQSSHYCIYNTGTATTDISGGIFHSTGAAAVFSYGSSSIVRIHGGYFSSDSMTTSLMATGDNGKLYVWEPTCYDRPLITARTVKNDGVNTAAYSRYNTTNTDSDTKAQYPFKVANVTAANAILTTVGSSQYRSNVEAAELHAKIASADITLKPNGNNTTAAPAINLTNDAGHKVTFDLNGKTLTTTTNGFITTSGKLDIVDNGATKGIITSSKEDVIVNNGGTVNIDGITLTTSCEKFSGNYIYSNAAIRNTSAGTMTISNSTIYTQKELAAINNTGSGSDLTIETSEISASTSGTGGCAVTTGTGSILTILSGQFYNNASSGARPTIYYTGTSANPSLVHINGGYYYNADSNGRNIRASTVANTQYIEVSAGYFNRDLSGYSSTSGHAPSIASGSQMTSVSITEHNNTLNDDFQYTIKVTPSNGESN